MYFEWEELYIMLPIYPYGFGKCVAASGSQMAHTEAMWKFLDQ